MNVTNVHDAEYMALYKGSNALSVLIGAEKQDIGTIFPYLDILQSFGLREKSLAHTKTLFTAYGYDTAFGRGNVMALLGLTASPASELPRKLLAVNVIYLVKGMGKGRYRFAPAKAQHGMF